MNNDSLSFDNQKKHLEREVADFLLQAAQFEKIKIQEIKPIAQEILPDFERISNFSELLIFLEKISKKWSFFSFLFNKYKNELDKIKEQQIIERLSTYLKNINPKSCN
jgi:hypothetical protein